MKLAKMFALAAALAVTGCVSRSAETPGKPDDFHGKVDDSLPELLRAKQAAVRDILSNLQQGMPPEKIAGLVPGVKRFEETSGSFLEGAPRLTKWAFNGSPSSDAVPVLLWFDATTGNDTLKKVERVYHVTGKPGRFVVARK